MLGKLPNLQGRTRLGGIIITVQTPKHDQTHTRYNPKPKRKAQTATSRNVEQELQTMVQQDFTRRMESERVSKRKFGEMNQLEILEKSSAWGEAWRTTNLRKRKCGDNLDNGGVGEEFPRDQGEFFLAFPSRPHIRATVSDEAMLSLCPRLSTSTKRGQSPGLPQSGRVVIAELRMPRSRHPIGSPSGDASPNFSGPEPENSMQPGFGRQRKHTTTTTRERHEVVRLSMRPDGIENALNLQENVPNSILSSSLCLGKGGVSTRAMSSIPSSSLFLPIL